MYASLSSHSGSSCFTAVLIKQQEIRWNLWQQSSLIRVDKYLRSACGKGCIVCPREHFGKWQLSNIQHEHFESASKKIASQQLKMHSIKAARINCMRFARRILKVLENEFIFIDSVRYTFICNFTVYGMTFWGLFDKDPFPK